MTDEPKINVTLGTSLRVAVLVFILGCLSIALVLLAAANAIIPTGKVFRGPVTFAVVVCISATFAFILARRLFCAIRTGRLQYPVRLRIRYHVGYFLRTAAQSAKHGCWHPRHVVSSVLLGIVLLACGRSYWQADILSFPISSMTSLRWVSCSGILMIEYFNYPENKSKLTFQMRNAREFMQAYEFWTLSVASIMNKNIVDEGDYGFYAFRTKNWAFVAQGRPYKMRSLNVPYWLLLILFAIMPGRAIAGGFLRYRRSLVMCCRECGYNLTGNMSGICPECGQPWKQGPLNEQPCHSPGQRDAPS